MNLLASEPLFTFLAFGSCFFAIATVLTPHLLRSAIYLMAVLTLSAGLYLLLGAEFLAGIQILVYVGGIVVLLVYAVMLTRSESMEEDRPTASRKLLGAVASLSFFGGSSWLLWQSPLSEGNAPDVALADIKALGHALLDYGSAGYVLPFEVISLLLLSVLIGGIVIARKEVR